MTVAHEGKLAGESQSLTGFTLAELAPFTREGEFAPDAPKQHRLFYVGRDDVHGILAYLFARITVSVYLNMFGYDDDELNKLLMAAAEDPHITTMVTLDKSQAGGVHEKAILATNVVNDPRAYAASFAIGESTTHQISHTKGGVLDGRVGFEGSTNWSGSGEGTFNLGAKKAGGPGYKAQNNTLMVFTDSDSCARFTAELVAEHMTASQQLTAAVAKAAAPKAKGKA